MMHKSVLLNESIEGLNIRDGLIYVDCTLGYGGHSKEILKRIKRGWLYAFDQDEDAVKYSTDELSKISNNFVIINSNFINLKSELEKRNIKRVDGILFDLGVSSPQIDNADRGFSYTNDSELDMRMDRRNKLTAKKIVNEYSYDNLIRIFFEYGEERYSKNIAKKICEYRDKKEINTTLELVDIIRSSVPEKYKRETNPARRVFQAIRIEVNNELEVFTKALEVGIDVLNPGGRICVITFHSLEDRICKNIFKKYSEVNPIFKGLPIIPDEYKPILKVIDKIKPNDKEVEENSRSKSSTLRIAERI
jgi:16S rRNA (cytosine1402-N4)-methyltransferase